MIGIKTIANMTAADILAKPTAYKNEILNVLCNLIWWVSCYSMALLLWKPGVKHINSSYWRIHGIKDHYCSPQKIISNSPVVKKFNSSDWYTALWSINQQNVLRHTIPQNDEQNNLKKQLEQEEVYKYYGVNKSNNTACHHEQQNKKNNATEKYGSSLEQN